MDANGMAEFIADLERSRAKYPNNAMMFDGLIGEVDELRRAYAGDGDIRAEAFDVAVCAFRIATEGDSGGNSLLDTTLNADRFRALREAAVGRGMSIDAPTLGQNDYAAFDVHADSFKETADGR